MFELSRRKFLKYLGQGSAVFGMGLSRNSWAQTRGSKIASGTKSTVGKYSDRQNKADVTVIGGGGGGLIAAVAAAEQGAKVVILERRGVLGGNAVRTGGPPSRGSIQEEGIAAMASPEQKGVVTQAGRDEFFRKAVDWSHCRSDARLVRTLINKSGDTIRWLGEKGMQFNDYMYPSKEEPPFAFGFGPGNRGVVLVKTLIKLCEDLGVQVLLNTRAKKLLTSQDGRIIGVVTEGKEGEVSIHAKSVIMSTGGFLGNRELMKKYFHSYTTCMRIYKWGGYPIMAMGCLWPWR